MRSGYVVVFAAFVVFLFSFFPTLAYGYTAPVTASYYAEPIFSENAVSQGVVNLGFPFPEGAPPYTPSQIASYYGFSSLWEEGREGQGETIVIVDAFGSPTIYQDVAVFDAVFDLPAVQLTVVPLPGANVGSYSDKASWAMETSLDVEWAHAMAPYAKIVLVEASDDSLSALYAAVSYAVNAHLGQVISMSWGAPEPELLGVTGPGSISSFDSLFQEAVAEGITPVASSGDEGAYNGLSFLNVNYPASDPNVLAVGGTNLTLSTAAYGTEAYRGYTIPNTHEYLWVDSGGGQSEYFPEQPWQENAEVKLTTSAGTVEPTGRVVPDVSYVADSPYGPTGWGGLWIYDSTPVIIPVSGQTVYVLQGWYGVGGTSCGAPQWSALLADVASSSGEAPGLGLITPIIYAQGHHYKTYFNPVIPYNNLNSNGYYYYSPRWDAVTGWGSPKVTSVASLV